jgi:hypothetical protein
VIGVPTGTSLQRFYQFATNGGILTALNEFPTIGICDFRVVWSATGHWRGVEVYAPALGSVKYNYPIVIDPTTITDLEGAVDGSQVGTAQRVLGQGSTGSSEDIGYAAFPSFVGGRVSQIGQFIRGTDFVTASDLNFTSADVGQGIYCLTPGVIEVGTTIVAIISTSTVQISQAAAADAPNAITGVGGIIFDVSQSATTDQPISTLQGTAEGFLRKQLASQVLPTAKQRADGPAGLFGNVDIGDVIPVRIDYGWLDVETELFRVNIMTLYPPTEELALQLNVVAVPTS